MNSTQGSAHPGGGPAGPGNTGRGNPALEIQSFCITYCLNQDIPRDTIKFTPNRLKIHLEPEAGLREMSYALTDLGIDGI